MVDKSSVSGTANASQPAPWCSYATALRASGQAYTMIREFEGLRLVAYGDIGGVMTIGYGHTRNVRPGETITRATAEQYLHEDIQTCEHDIGMTVCVQMTQNQYDALVSWIFNLGLGAWQKSGALRHLNMGEYDTCIAIMQLYIRAADRIIPGLQRRREAEALLWREPDAETAQKP